MPVTVVNNCKKMFVNKKYYLIIIYVIDKLQKLPFTYKGLVVPVFTPFNSDEYVCYLS